MATVATVYPVERYRRTPAEVVAALFRDAPEPSRERPKPQHKQVWARLPREDVPGSRIAGAFAWMIGELYLRGRARDKPLVFLSDGQAALWAARSDWLPERAVDILDLLHVTPRLWQAAHVFEEEGSPPAEDVVRDRLLRVLQGKAAGVIRGLREMATKRGLAGAKQRTLGTVCAYREANVERMRYDEYLAAGYPIASGVVEGACRHLVKDRMERAGMHGTLPGPGDARCSQHPRQRPVGGISGVPHCTRGRKTLPTPHLGRAELHTGSIAEQRLRPIHFSFLVASDAAARSKRGQLTVLRGARPCRP